MWQYVIHYYIASSNHGTVSDEGKILQHFMTKDMRYKDMKAM